MVTVKFPLVLVCVFLWIGFVCAISFLEAWLKFRAPGITMPLGLGIGRLVYSVLNKIEWVFAIAIILTMFLRAKPFFLPANMPAIVAVMLVLLIQTLWLLPVLDARATMLIAGKTPGPASYHIYYVAGEVIKVAGLFIFGMGLFKTV